MGENPRFLVSETSIGLDSFDTAETALAEQGKDDRYDPWLWIQEVTRVGNSG